MPLGTEVGFDPGDIVLDGDPALTHTERGNAHPSLFGPAVTISATAELLFVVLNQKNVSKK